MTNPFIAQTDMATLLPTRISFSLQIIGQWFAHNRWLRLSPLVALAVGCSHPPQLPHGAAPPFHPATATTTGSAGVRLNPRPRQIQFPSTAPVVVPFDTDAGMPVVDVVLPGGQHRRYVLDTGASSANVALVDTPLATRQPPTSRFITRGGGGPQAENVSTVGLHKCSLSLSSIQFKEFDAESTPYPKSLIDSWKQPVQGGLGWPMFYDMLLTVDYAKHQLVLEQGALPPPNGTDILPLGLFADEFSGPRLSVNLDGHPHWVILDTGASYATNVEVASGRNVPVRWIYPPATFVQNFFGGPVPGRMGLSNGDLEIGRYVVPNPMVDEVPGNIDCLSAKTLQHFRVTFDFANRRVRLTGPAGAPSGCDRIVESYWWDESTEQFEQPRHVRKVSIDDLAARRGVTVTVKNGARLVSRPPHAVLLLTDPGVFVDMTGDYDYTLNPDGRVDLNSGAQGGYGVSRWYEPSVVGDQQSETVWLNPGWMTWYRHADPATGQLATSNGFVTVTRQRDGSSCTVLTDGLTLDWSVDGDLVVRWPDPPATRALNKSTSRLGSIP